MDWNEQEATAYHLCILKFPTAMSRMLNNISSCVEVRGEVHTEMIDWSTQFGSQKNWDFLTFQAGQKKNLVVPIDRLTKVKRFEIVHRLPGSGFYWLGGRDSCGQ